MVLGLIKSLPPGDFSVFIDSLIPLLKHFQTKGVRLHWPNNPNMWQNCPYPYHKSIKPVGDERRMKNAKDNVNVLRPSLIASSNKYMGGTDQMDQAILAY